MRSAPVNRSRRCTCACANGPGCRGARNCHCAGAAGSATKRVTGTDRTAPNFSNTQILFYFPPRCSFSDGERQNMARGAASFFILYKWHRQKIHKNPASYIRRKTRYIPAPKAHFSALKGTFVSSEVCVKVTSAGDITACVAI